MTKCTPEVDGGSWGWSSGILVAACLLHHQKVRQAENAKRGSLKGVGEFPDGSSEFGVAVGDVVVTRVDLGVDDNAASEAIEQPLQAARGIRAHVWTQAVAQAIWQVVHEWNIAKAVFPSPVSPMRLKGKESIRDKHHQASARLCYPVCLVHCLTVIGYVF